MYLQYLYFILTTSIIFSIISCRSVKNFFREGVVTDEPNIVETFESEQKTKTPKTFLDKPKEQTYSYYSQKWNVALNGTEDIRLIQEIDTWLGVPYKYGGNTRQGTDCSGMVLSIYKNIYGIDLKRSAYELWQQAQWISPEELKFGDLVFFQTKDNKVSHVGIYIADSYFVHASSSRGVVIDNLNTDYYKKRFVSAGRIIIPHKK